MYTVNLIPEKYSGWGFKWRLELKTAGIMAALVFLLLILIFVYFKFAATGCRMDTFEYHRGAVELAVSPADMERIQKERRVYEARIQLIRAISRKESLMTAPAENIIKAAPAGLVLTCLEIKRSGVEGPGSGLKKDDDSSNAEFNENLVITGKVSSLEMLGEYISAIQGLEIFQHLRLCEATWENHHYKFILSARFNNSVEMDATETGNND